MTLFKRHSHDEIGEGQYTKYYFGYATRVLPCEDGEIMCDYLDLVYSSISNGNLYTFVLWSIIVSILILLFLINIKSIHPIRRLHSQEDIESKNVKQSLYYRVYRSIMSYTRQHLLFNVYKGTTGVQIMALVGLIVYLTVFSFLGLRYNIWITPAESGVGNDTRTTLGPYSNRMGVFAFALTPLSILLSSRESFLSLVTGIPYQSFNFLHRWVGYIIVFQATVHSIGWTIVGARLYGPQPQYWYDFVKEPYIIWGIIGVVSLWILLFFTLPISIKYTGYEFFRKMHYLIAILYIGAIWAHWKDLYCWLLPSVAIWGIDRLLRLLRTYFIHTNIYLAQSTSKWNIFQPAKANITYFRDKDNGDVIRLDFEQRHSPWRIGQHFFLCFPELSIWQAHPFTPSSSPNHGFVQKHTYIIRAKGGETKKLALLAKNKFANGVIAQTSVILGGPYGASITSRLDSIPDMNILCIAGGTGITYVLPVIYGLLARVSNTPDRRVQLVWAVRKQSDIDWIRTEYDDLLSKSQQLNLKIDIFITRESKIVEEEGVKSKEEKQFIELDSDIDTTATSHIYKASKEASKSAERRHPSVAAILSDFLHDVPSKTPSTVYLSGPPSMISDARQAVSKSNSGRKVFSSEDRFDVSLVCDDRLEW